MTIKLKYSIGDMVKIKGTDKPLLVSYIQVELTTYKYGLLKEDGGYLVLSEYQIESYEVNNSKLGFCLNIK